MHFSPSTSRLVVITTTTGSEVLLCCAWNLSNLRYSSCGSTFAANLFFADHIRGTLHCQTGFVHHASSTVRIFAQLSKDLVLPLDIRSGVEVSIRKHSALRCGFSTQRRTITCGYGFQRGRLSADIYQGWSQRTGMRFGMTISCLLRRSGEQ